MFKTIPKYPRYACSENGVIINQETGKQLSQSINTGGYIQHCISVNGKRHIIFPHRIVAELYVDNPDGKICVNHIDGNKTNNNYTNLEWCTTQENTYHAINTLNKNQGGKNKKAVVCIETSEIFESCCEAAENFKTHNSLINAICNGKKKSFHGLHFKFV